MRLDIKVLPPPDKVCQQKTVTTCSMCGVKISTNRRLYCTGRRGTQSYFNPPATRDRLDAKRQTEIDRAE